MRSSIFFISAFEINNPFSDIVRDSMTRTCSSSD